MVQRRGATTIRVPRELIEQARRVKNEGESFNELVVDAIAHEVRRQGLQVFAAIGEIRDQVARGRARSRILFLPFARCVDQGHPG